MYPLKKLSEICDIFAGGDVPKDALSQIKTSEYNIPIFSNGEKNKGLYGYTNITRVTCPSITISARGTIGYSEIRMEDFYPAIRLVVITPKDSSIDLCFLKYAIEQLDFTHSGTSIPQLTVPMVKEYAIPLPPLSIQLDIVARLDSAMAEIEALRRETESALASTRELWESTLESVFTVGGNDWEEKTFEDICEISSKLIDPKEEQYHSFLHVGGANIESITGKLIDLKTAKEEKLISGKFLFDENIVLYSKIRPYLIKVTRPDFVGLCSADIYPLSPKKNILNKDFLYYILISKNFTDYAIKGSARAGMPKVNREHLFAYNVFLPPLPEQFHIVAHLDAVRAETEKLEKLYKEKLASLDELRKSVLQEAFI